MAENTKYPIKRNLDSIYFRVERDGKFENICFSDLTTHEQHKVIKKYDSAQLTKLCVKLANTIRKIGDELDVEIKH